MESLLRLALALGLAGLLLLPAAVAVAGFAYYQVFQRVLPGVYVGEARLGGLTIQQAAVEIQKTWNLERQLTVTDGLHTWQLAPASLGLSVDPLKTARNAYAVGHEQGLLAEIDQMVYSLDKGWGVAPVVTLDAQAARKGLQALAQQASLAPKDATIRLEGDRLVSVPGEVGYTINIEDTLAALAQDPLGTVLNGYLRVSLKPVPPRINDVSEAMAQAEKLLNAQVVLHAYDPVRDESQDWTVPRQVLASWLKIENGDGGPVASLDEQKAGEYLGELSDSLGPERWIEVDQYRSALVQAVQEGKPFTMIVRHHPTSYTVQSGDTMLKIGWKVGIPYWMIVQANPGLNADKLYAGQQLVLPSKDDLLPLPVVLGKRIVIDISSQRLYVYQDGKQLSKYVISTGIDRSPTQPGVFQVQTHEINAYASVWDLYMPHFLGIYEAWPGFMNGIHGLPTLSNGRRLWASILGRPASYGCIILDLKSAEWLYKWAENGVVVEIRE